MFYVDENFPMDSFNRDSDICYNTAKKYVDLNGIKVILDNIEDNIAKGEWSPSIIPADKVQFNNGRTLEEEWGDMSRKFGNKVISSRLRRKDLLTLCM